MWLKNIFVDEIIYTSHRYYSTIYNRFDYNTIFWISKMDDRTPEIGLYYICG